MHARILEIHIIKFYNCLPFELFESPEGEFGSELGEGVLLSGQSPPMPSPFSPFSPENRFKFRFQSCYSVTQD